MTKMCRTCLEEKSIEEFGRNRSKVDGRLTQCKSCLVEYVAEYWVNRKDKKEMYKEYNKRFTTLRASHLKEYREGRVDIDRALRRTRYVNDRAKIIEETKVRDLLNPGQVKMRGSNNWAKMSTGASSLPTDTWDRLISFYGNKCMVEGCVNINLSIDHIIPLSKGGSHTVDNLQILCGPHNTGKGNHHSTDYRPFPRYEPDLTIPGRMAKIRQILEGPTKEVQHD